MIELDLAEARAQKKRLYVWLVGGLAVFLLTVSILVMLLGAFKEVADSGDPVNTGPSHQSRLASDGDLSSTSSLSARDRNALDAINGDEKQDEFKEAFLKKLKDYKENIRPQIFAFESLKVDRDLNALVEQGEGEAALAASQGRFKDGSELLSKLIVSIEKKIALEEAKLRDIFESMQKAWSEKNLDLLASAVASARVISPEHPSLKKFASLAQDWPKVQDLLQESLSFKNKGDLRRAILSLQAIKPYVHDVSDLDSRISALQTAQGKATEGRLIEQLSNSLNASNLDEAAAVIEKLRRQSVPETSYAHLVQEFQRKKYLEDLAKLNSALEGAIQKDNWAEAKNLVGRFRSKFGEDSNFRSKETLIERINSSLKVMEDVLSRPDQLTSSRIRASIHVMLETIQPDLGKSPELRTKAKEVGFLLEKYRTKVAITILSDGFTSIEVKSVGKIGEVSEKVIQLLPGNYIIIGKKAGYVSKQVDLRVLPLTPQKVMVISDEPI
jgi:hypothetical protein